MPRVGPSCRFGMLAAALLTLGRESAIHADFANLQVTVGADSNPVMAIKVQEVLETPLRRREQRKDSLLSGAESRTLMLPPSASEFVLAADFDLKLQRPTGRTAGRKPRFPTTLRAVAKPNGRVIENIA